MKSGGNDNDNDDDDDQDDHEHNDGDKVMKSVKLLQYKTTFKIRSDLEILKLTCLILGRA